MCLLLIMLMGCASTTIPVSYVPQGFVRYTGQASIGNFEYIPSKLPAKKARVAPSQIQGVARGKVYVSANIAKLAQRATALELEKTGIKLSDDHLLRIDGEVLEFKVRAEGQKNIWTYAIRYKIVHKTDGIVLLNKIYSAEPVMSGRQNTASDLSPFINELILSGYNKFIGDGDVKKIFSDNDY